MRMITKLQISAMHAIMSENKMQDDKRDIIRQISNGRTESTTMLTETEAQEWINSMNRRKVEKIEKPGQRMINNIIAMAREMGVITRGMTVNTQCGQLVTKSDYSRFNKWMEEKSYLKKKLNDYSYEELPKLVSQYKAIYSDWLKKKN